MLDAVGRATVVDFPSADAGAPSRRTPRVIARLAAGADVIVSAEVLAVLALLGGVIMIIYTAYSVDLRLGHASVGAALLVLAKMLYTPAPSEAQAEGGDEGRPDGYEGVRRR